MGLSQTQQKRMRRKIEHSLLTDVCDIYYQLITQSGAGDGIRRWVMKPNGSNVKCRVEQIQFRSQQIESYANREVISIVYKFYFPYNTDVHPNERIVFKGENYEIRVLEDDQTENLYVIAHVSRQE